MKWTCGILAVLLAVSMQAGLLLAQDQPAAKADETKATATTNADETKKADETTAKADAPAAAQEPAKADETKKTDEPKTETAKTDGAAAGGEKKTEPTCKVTSVTGSVEWRPTAEAAWQPLKAGDTLPVGADVCTGFRARCMLEFMDESSAVEVEPMTVLRIGEFEKTGNKVRTRVYLQRGSTKTVVEKSRFESDFAIVTPEVTLAVRGTKVIRCRQSPDMGFAIGLSQSGGINVTNHGNGRGRNLRPGDHVYSGLAMMIQNVTFGSQVWMFDLHGGMTHNEQFSVLYRPGMFGWMPGQNSPNGSGNPIGNPRQTNIKRHDPNVPNLLDDGIIHEWECEG